LVVKRNGVEEPFDRQKIVAGLISACKNRPVTLAAVESFAEDVEEAMRASQVRPVPSAEIGREVLERLRELDDVAYLRFASVYKDFQELNDFERELGQLLKKLPPKTPGAGE
jgi:transcriptional repressor NrdR